MISGKVISNEDVENIHVINTTAQLFTVTNAQGRFNIRASINDTLEFTGVKYKALTIVITKDIVDMKYLEVELDEAVTALDEVIVGKVLTGDLMMDVGNSDAKPQINFYDVGIPGYKGPRMTPAQRRLHEAQGGKQITLGMVTSVPLNPIINAITGRTKKLKKHVKLDAKADLLHKIRTNLAKEFFETHSLEEDRQMDFWYFCSDDPEFELRCKGKSDLEIFIFLKEKLGAYRENMKIKKG